MTAVEDWMPVAGTDGEYIVSRAGEVASMKSTDKDGCARILKQSTMKGYKVVTPSVKGKARTRLVHHLVLEAFVGPRPDGMEARHLDGNGSNNALTNLVWGTSEENAEDKVRHGTSFRRPNETRDGVVYLVCNKCQCWKPEGEFPKLYGKILKASYFGRGPECRVCSIARRNASRRKRDKFHPVDVAILGGDPSL